ncbi:MAG: N-acyl-D-glucosamine 2-epimerase [Paludibacter sp. SCN 51-9]|nr:MAG: N-acyl-D-glucosamine 2-epimerase [Paludibacter sp. SCN 51-9]
MTARYPLIINDSMKYNLLNLRQEVREELLHNILPWWMEHMPDDRTGGFHGRIDGKGELKGDASRGGVLNARILWTFSSAVRQLKNELYLPFATRAFDYIQQHFIDPEQGGTYWELNPDGSVKDPKKQIYAQAFFAYAFTEYFRATGDNRALANARQLFHLIEEKSFDKEKNGYFEAYSRDWQLLDDRRLSAKDANEKKTMNTHLHILEAYTNLFRVWKDDVLRKQLHNLIELFLSNILNQQTHHLSLFFDEEWNRKSQRISYGHDIEAAWLLVEAAEVLGDKALLRKVEQRSVWVTAAAAEGWQPDGSLINETDPATGHTDSNRDWWVQAEAMVGFYNAYSISGDEKYAQQVLYTWEYVKLYLIDRQQGEWFWAASPEGQPDTVNDKAGFWKCPYHNSRMCFEVMQRIKS